MKYSFIAQQRGRWPISWMCSALNVTRRGYYAWRSRGRNQRTLADTLLTAQLRLLFANRKGAYGSPRLRAELRGIGIACSRKRVARLMNRAGLSALLRPRRVKTTQPDPAAEPAPNLLDRRFAPGTVAAWVADVTYLRTGQGWLYLAVVMNLYSRRILSYSFSLSCNSALCLAALNKALARQRPQPGTLHHSDRGSTYTAGDYQQALRDNLLVASMSATGDCYDNAVMESWFNSLKREAFQRRTPGTRAQARVQVTAFIEDYNRSRFHSSLDGVSPERFEELHPVLN